MPTTQSLGGDFTFPGTSITVHRMGYGAMQLAGPHVFGPPKDIPAALAVLREVVESGINHIDTSDFYGPHITNQLIKQELHPYTRDLTLVTKVGARRGNDGSWIQDLSPAFLKQSIHDNLRNLGLDTIPIVNVRSTGLAGPSTDSIAEAVTAMAELQHEGLIQHIGLSNISPAQFAEAIPIANIVCVQNNYNIAHRDDDAFIDHLATLGIAYVPYFPLGGFTPLQSSTLNDAAAALHTKPMVVALAWLLQRSPNMLLIPGTSSIAHLRENISAASLEIPADILQNLNNLNQTL
jgi:aryl-alcohol dehydrogenase-like predicted oxidoreductase